MTAVPTRFQTHTKLFFWKFKGNFPLIIFFFLIWITVEEIYTIFCLELETLTLFNFTASSLVSF